MKRSNTKKPYQYLAWLSTFSVLIGALLASLAPSYYFHHYFFIFGNTLLALTGYDPEYGARPIKKEIRNVIEDQISELIITNEVKDGKKLFLDVSAVDD